MKKLFALLLTFSVMMTGAGALAGTFTDSCGREFALDDEITRVAVSGPYAQIVLFALAPDLLVGLSGAWDEADIPFVGEYAELPVLGQLYGGKGSMNLEQIAALAPQIVLDVGETSQETGKELDALTEQLGIPFVHVGMDLDSAAEGFEMLGELLGRQEQAAALAAYCRDTLAQIDALMARVGDDRVRFLYCLGEEGLSVVAKGSYHAQMIDRLTDNVAVFDNPSSRGTGNAIDMEQMLLLNPDAIVFAPGGFGKEAAEDPVWQAISAVEQGRYATVPDAPYNWMGYPPSVQRYMGMQYLAHLLYPQHCEGSLQEAAEEYYRLFYHCELTQEMYDALMAGALFR
ncbi:MAG: ABC transporter substrate-binding protein [Clostridia bacterium]|nr:ABC transporter substrate-binding protein [Clostridia bacterium]